MLAMWQMLINFWCFSNSFIFYYFLPFHYFCWSNSSLFSKETPCQCLNLVKFSYKVLVVLHWVKPETNITTSSLKCVHNSVLDARMYQSSVRRDCAYDWSFDVQSCLGCPATRAPASFQCKALWTYFPQANWQCTSQVTNMILNNGGAITLPDVHVRLFEPSCSIRAPWPARDGIPHPCDANRIDKQCGAQSQT